MARPATPGLFAAATVSFGLMAVMAATSSAGGGADERSLTLVFLAGVAASSAMILPGVSGAYLLLLLGQYEPILETIDQLRRGVVGDGTAGPDVALILDAMWIVVPLGLGIVVGVVGVSNLLRWLLERAEKATLGALLGLLLGAVVGLWPFTESPDPTPGQFGGATAFVLAGFATTVLLGRLGGTGDDEG